MAEEGGTPAENPSEGEQKKLWAGQYESPEDMERGHLELRKKFSQATATPPAPPPADPPPTKGLSLDVPPEEVTLDTIMARAGTTYEQTMEAWNTKGGLTAEQYAGFQQQGYSRPMVDQFIRGQVAEQGATAMDMDTAKTNVQKMMGSDQQLKNLLAWGGQNVTPEQRATIEQQLADPDQMETAVRVLRDMHSQATGGASGGEGGGGLELGGEVPGAGGGEGFADGEAVMKGIHQLNVTGGRDAAAMAKMAQTPDDVILGAST